MALSLVPHRFGALVVVRLVHDLAVVEHHLPGLRKKMLFGQAVVEHHCSDLPTMTLLVDLRCPQDPSWLWGRQRPFSSGFVARGHVEGHSVSQQQW